MNTIEEILEDFRIGKPVVIVDDENRENEGDLIAAAEKVDYATVNLMVGECRGLMCAPLSSTRAEELGLRQMEKENNDAFSTAFTVSVDGFGCTTTGISVQDRLNTLRWLADPTKTAADFRKPGHLFPLAARDGGVLERPGHTEAAVDLTRLCGLQPAAVICEILNDDGTMARLPQLQLWASRHGFKIGTVADLIEYRKKNDSAPTPPAAAAPWQAQASAMLPTAYGSFRMSVFKADDKEHFALVKGDLGDGENVLLRLHSECLTGDLLSSRRCDCGSQLHQAMEAVEKEGRGVIVYLRQEGRGIGLVNKLKAYVLQDEGLDTVDANLKLGFREDERDYTAAVRILQSLGVRSVRLISNNPEKAKALAEGGIAVVETVHPRAEVTEENRRYLETKNRRMGHSLRF